MQHETATVKKVVKKYTTKNGDEKESISYKITFKSDFAFDDGDDVAVVLYDDFKDLDNVSADEIQNLKNDVADKSAAISDLNESNDKLNAELKDKFNKINDVTAKLKASEKTVDELESDISAKNDIINKNDKTIAELSAKNNELHKKLDELTDLLTGKDKTIDSLDETIVNYKVKIAELNAVDIDKLKEKSDELDNVKNELIDINKRLDNKSNVISLLQNQIMELQQLVNYKDSKIDKLENKGVLDTIFKKDVTANITAPTLYLIDASGNLIKENPDIDVDATVDDNDDDSGKDTITKI